VDRGEAGLTARPETSEPTNRSSKHQQLVRGYHAFLKAKVDAARAQVPSGDVASNAAVEERLVSRRAELRAKVERR
jgi:hypothetical protein